MSPASTAANSSLSIEFPFMLFCVDKNKLFIVLFVKIRLTKRLAHVSSLIKGLNGYIATINCTKLFQLCDKLTQRFNLSGIAHTLIVHEILDHINNSSNSHFMLIGNIVFV